MPRRGKLESEEATDNKGKVLYMSKNCIEDDPPVILQDMLKKWPDGKGIVHAVPVIVWS